MTKTSNLALLGGILFLIVSLFSEGKEFIRYLFVGLTFVLIFFIEKNSEMLSKQIQELKKQNTTKQGKAKHIKIKNLRRKK